jgi:hypothetical protein
VTFSEFEEAFRDAAEAAAQAAAQAAAAEAAHGAAAAIIRRGHVADARRRLLATAKTVNAFAKVAQRNLDTAAAKAAGRAPPPAPVRPVVRFSMPAGWRKVVDKEDCDAYFVEAASGASVWHLWHRAPAPSGDGEDGGAPGGGVVVGGVGFVWFDCSTELVHYVPPAVADDDASSAVVDSAGRRLTAKGTGADAARNADLAVAEALAKVGTALFSHGDRMRSVFASIDTDGNGQLDSDEFASALVRLGLGLERSESDSVFALVDEDGGGSVTFSEFEEAFRDAAEAAAQAAAQAAAAGAAAVHPSGVRHLHPAGGRLADVIAPLPAGWQALVDESSGDTYYFNEATQESAWERPLAP